MRGWRELPPRRRDPALPAALAQVKSAAAWTDDKLGALGSDIAQAVMAAARGVVEGGPHEHFPLKVAYRSGDALTWEPRGLDGISRALRKLNTV
ncbi:hypothetical protein [Nonomuraea sp. NPDC003709]|uniref:hypothetical protein n=1 Tax=Nonomuraea sp. NPDC003709 TaxID=3154450 RepID=UPI00339F2D1A